MSKYLPNQKTLDQINNAFTHHSPKEDQEQRYTAIRDKAGELAHLIAAETPFSREQSSALTRLEECVMHALAAIAHNE